MRLAVVAARRRRTPAAPRPIAPTTRAADLDARLARRAARARSLRRPRPSLKCASTFDRQELDRRAQARHLAHQRLLDLAAQRRGAAERPAAPARACAGRRSGGWPARRVTTSSKRTAARGEARQRAVDAAPAPRARAPCPSGRRPSAATTRTPSRRMLSGDADRDHRVEPQPAGELDQHQRRRRRRRRPDVGEEVARVGLERDRAVLARRLRSIAPGEQRR